VRRIIVIGIVVVLAVLFVQPIRAYRSAQEELDRARVQLREAREVKQRAVEERDALGTREMLVREARRRGYIFPGETPFSVGER
jgi:type II secretory pathway pseudopilin PulG